MKRTHTPPPLWLFEGGPLDGQANVDICGSSVIQAVRGADLRLRSVEYRPAMHWQHGNQQIVLARLTTLGKRRWTTCVKATRVRT